MKRRRFKKKKISGLQVINFDRKFQMATCKDLSRSVVAASDELKEIYCEPCLDGGKPIEAEGFCVDCAEYLCGQCYKMHRRFKAFKHHVLKDKGEMPLDLRKSRAPDVCVERCDIHPTKIVEYFCRSCDILGCSACITVSHRQCENVDHIPDIAKDLNSSEEFKTFLSELERKLDEIKQHKEKIRLNTNIADDIKKQGKAELRRQRDQVNTFFDNIEADMDRRMEDITKANKHSLKTATRTADSIYNDLIKIKTNVKSKQEGNQNCELFIEMQHSNKSFNVLDNQFKQLREERRIQPFFLTPSNQIQNIKDNTTEICRLRSAKFLTMFDIRAGTDVIIINGLVAIQSHFLAILISNHSVKVIDTKKKKAASEIVLQCEHAWSITTVKADQLAVLTSSDNQSIIQLLSVDLLGNIRKDDQVALKNVYSRLNSAFIFKNEKFIMIDYMEICIFDLKGKHLKTIPTSYATGIACSPDGNIIYLANPMEHTVTSFTFDLDDTVRAIYKERRMEIPSKIIADNEGSIYVCCFNNIYHLSGDLGCGHIVINDNMCTSIAYCDQRLILGHSNFVKVFVVEG